MDFSTAEAGLVSLLKDARKHGVSIWANDLQLREAQFPEQTWLIDGVVPAAAYVLLVAGPKVGKTAMMLPIALRLAREGRRVWYLVLDDSARRIRQRSMMAQPMSSPEHAGLSYNFKWSPRTAIEAFGELNRWLENARAEGMTPDLVVIDTYGQMIGRRPHGVDLYRYDCEQGDALKAISEEFGCTVIASSHTNKSGNAADDDWLNTISGTNGMAAAADMLWGLYRARGTRDGILKATGNDFEETEVPMTLGPDMVWRPAEGVTPAQASHGGTARQVLDYLAGVAQASFRELLNKINCNPNTLNSTLTRLAQENTVESVDGVWSLTVSPRNRVLNLEREAGPDPRVVDSATGEPDETRTGPAADAGGMGSGATSTDSVAPVPAQRTGAVAVAPEGWEETPEGSSEAFRQLYRTVTGSRLKALITLDPDIKAEITSAKVQTCVGSVVANWQFKIQADPGSQVIVFDRKAAFWQGHPWIVPNRLHRRGTAIGWDEITSRDLKWAGMFAVRVTPWRDTRFPNPWGPGVKAGEQVLVTRDLLARLRQLADEDLCEFPVISHGFVGKGTEELLLPWFRWCLEDRRTAVDAEDQKRRKAAQNAAMGSLRQTDPRKGPGIIDRPDWHNGIRSLNSAQMNRYGTAAVWAGEPLRAIGNSDEMVFQVPDGADPATWVPETLAKHVEKNRFARKYVMDAQVWNLGGWRSGWAKKSALIWRDGEWVEGGTQEL